MERPQASYKGDEPYVFVSYSHKDAALVYPELGWMQEAFNVWYDEGIEAGSEWTEALAGAIEGAALFIYFVTPASVESQNCRNEVNFAIDHDVDIIPIHLVETELPGGLSLTLSSRQAIHKYEQVDADYREKVETRMASFLDRKTTEKPEVSTTPVRHSWVRRHKVITGIGALVLAFVGGVTGWIVAAVPDELSVAVLPFVAAGGDAETEYFANSLSEEVLTSLAAPANSSSLPVGSILTGSRALPIVASRTASFQFAGSDVPLNEIGERLDVNYLIEGSVRKMGDIFRVAVQVVRPEDGQQVWSKTYEVGFGEDFAMQAGVAEHVAHIASLMMAMDLERHARGRLRRVAFLTGIDQLESMEQSLLASSEYFKIRMGEGGGDWRVYEQHLKRAVELSPESPLPSLILANAYQLRLGGLIVYNEAAPKVRAALDRAIAHSSEEDMDKPIFQWFVGQINANMDLDYAAADERLNRAIELDPTTYWPRYFLATIELGEGRQSGALRLMQNASVNAERDIQSATFQLTHAGVLNVVGEREKALAVNELGLNQTMDGPGRSSLLRQRAHLLIGFDRADEAARLVDEALAIDGGVNPEPYVALFVRLGDVDRANEILSGVELGYLNAGALAYGYLTLGDIPKTFAALELAVLNRTGSTITSLRLADWWDPIRDDPRFDALLELLDSMVIHTKRYQAEQDLRSTSG